MKMQKKVKTISFNCLMLFMTACVTLFASCSSDSEKENEEIQVTETTETDNSFSDDSFDSSYQIALLVNDYWEDTSNDSVYKFDEDMSFSVENSQKSLTGVYTVSGSDGYPLLNLEYNNSETETFVMSFSSDTSLTLTNYETEEVSQLENVKEKPEYNSTDEAQDSSYTVKTTKMENTNMEYPIIRGWKHIDAQEKYNNLFLKDIKKILDQSDSPETCSMNFKVYRNDEDILSLVGKGIVSSAGSAHPYYVLKCYNINMKTGEKIDISDAIDVSVASENLYNKKNCEIMTDDMTLDELIEISMLESPEYIAANMENMNNFYYDKSGNVCVYFESSYITEGYVAVKFE